ncbi:hypothetical protein CR105_22690 [Massilia eurypsychrophila]|jgi:hypothetical protein|uniref:Uncharacterized protein n=1 Tax=Massilia eurypsychrophila TaxID=1485217 RepID=A0A2G8T9U5_9BURK|nr:hypothetical protein [Massilia eurypsychrophila]PIL42782.1 hypothetical protein CR105_22690 [Massilia eurypsychrophila]
MTNDNHCGQSDQDFPGSRAQAHCQLALEQSARYEAQLAIARWMTASADVPARDEIPAPALGRAAWLAQAQTNFQQWLGCGGFSQYEVAPSDISALQVGIYFLAGKPPAIPGLFRSCVD